MNSPQFVYLLRFLFFSGLVWAVFFNVSVNPSVDAVAYANGVASQTDFIYPHHLLHGIAGRLIWLPALSLLTGADIAADTSGHTWLALSNGIAYLLIVFGVNQHLVKKGQALHPATLVMAAAWGLLRFAVEFEAYLWPLVFCLAALWALDRKRLSQAGIWLVVAVLYHQIAVFWVVAAGIVVYQDGEIRDVWRMARWLLCVPLVYVGVWLILARIGTTPPLPAFLLGEFAAGGVKTAFSLKHGALLPVSILRTWLQVHGYQYTLVTQQPAFSLLLATAGVIIAALVAVVGWVGSARLPTFLADAPVPPSARAARYAILGLLLAGLLSQGNAEFLVGLAPAVALAFPDFFERRRIASVGTASVLMGANIAFGLLPQQQLTLTPYPAEAAYSRTHTLPLATYHHLEVVTWRGTLCPGNRDSTQRLGCISHAQWLTSRAGHFYYMEKPVADTLVLYELSPPPPLSRATMLEQRQGAPPGRIGKTVETIHHIGGPTKLVELWPFE